MCRMRALVSGKRRIVCQENCPFTGAEGATTATVGAGWVATSEAVATIVNDAVIQAEENISANCRYCHPRWEVPGSMS